MLLLSISYWVLKKIINNNTYLLAWQNSRPFAFSTTGFHREMIESFRFWDKDNYEYEIL